MKSSNEIPRNFQEHQLTKLKDFMVGGVPPEIRQTLDFIDDRLAEERADYTGWASSLGNGIKILSGVGAFLSTFSLCAATAADLQYPGPLPLNIIGGILGGYALSGLGFGVGELVRRSDRLMQDAQTWREKGPEFQRWLREARELREQGGYTATFSDSSYPIDLRHGFSFSVGVLETPEKRSKPDSIPRSEAAPLLQIIKQGDDWYLINPERPQIGVRLAVNTRNAKITIGRYSNINDILSLSKAPSTSLKISVINPSKIAVEVGDSRHYGFVRAEIDTQLEEIKEQILIDPENPDKPRFAGRKPVDEELKDFPSKLYHDFFLETSQYKTYPPFILTLGERSERPLI